MEERFPDRAHTVRHDDGRWIADWLADHWRAASDRRLLRQQIDAEIKKGYSVEEALMAVLPAAGLWTHAAYGTWTELGARVGANVPVVVQLGVPAGKRRVRRFTVVTAMDAETVRLAMQGGVETTLSKEAFLAQWYWFRNWMLVSCPPDVAKWPHRSAERWSLIRHNDLIGRDDVADALAKEALAADPRNPDLATALGTRALQRGRLEEAEALLRAALQADDRHVRASNNLAYLLGLRGDNVEEALKLSQRAALLEPTNPRVLHTHGVLLCKAGRWKEGLLDLERAWSRAARLPIAARTEIGFSLALAYFNTGSPHLVCDVIRTLQRENPELRLPDDVQAQLDLAGNCR